MTYEVEEALKFEHASNELVEELKKYFYEDIEGCDFEFNGEYYSIVETDEDPIEDEGKYQYGGTYYQLVKYDKNISSWPSSASILEKYDIEIYLPYRRSGSYYSEYFYTYYNPIFSRIAIVDVPEVVIPAHQEVKTENIK